MTILLVIVHVFVCFFLIAVILLQAGRGQGLSWGVFGGTPESILGTKTSSFLSRLTTACAVLFLITCIGLNIVETRKARSLLKASQPSSQIDISNIKKALEKAVQEQTGPQEGKPLTATVTPNPETGEAQVALTTETVPAQPGAAKSTNTASGTE